MEKKDGFIKTILRRFKFSSFFILVSFFLIVGVDAAENLSDYCVEQFQNLNVCPEETCDIKECVDGSCETECSAKSCLSIDAKSCPVDFCQILLGCDQKPVCYPLSKYKTSECGEIAYVGGSECCEGFIKRCGVEFFDGSCDMIGEGSVDSVPMCLPCGNGICNQFENRCNCPEDCMN